MSEVSDAWLHRGVDWTQREALEWADRIEAGAGESFCADCPDHEACSQGAPCGHVKRIAVARAKAEAWEEGAIWAVSQDWMQPQKRSDGTIVVSSRLTSEPQFGNPYREAGEQP